VNNRSIAGRANLNRVHEPAKRSRCIDMLRHAHREGRHIERLADVADWAGMVFVVMINEPGGRRQQEPGNSHQD
jgi:hypothetical protein